MTSPYTAISLFSGCGGDTLGLERAGFKVVAFNEFKSTFVKTHLENFPHSVPLNEPKKDMGDITKLPDSVFEPYKGQIQVVFAGFPCFVKDTLVLTENGYKEIQNVTLDDKLMTHTGKFQSIVNLQRKSYSNTIYDIRIKYHPIPITATEEHPFYVREKKSKWNSEKRKYDISFNPPEWKNAKDLTPNHYFGMVVNTNEIVPEFNFIKKINQSSETLEIIRLDNEDQWFMMGYFVGDGWIQDTKKQNGNYSHIIRFSFNVDEKDAIYNRIKNVIPITYKDKGSPKCETHGCADYIWWSILKDFGRYAHGKKIPEWVQDAPKNLIQAFLDGYMAADGNIRKDGQLNYTTVSPDLAFGVQRLYLKLGHIFSVTKCKREKTCVIQGRTVNQRDTYQVRGSTKTGRFTTFIEDDYVWYAPSKISTRTVENEPVYNFEVENDNSYIVENTIVHNCQGYSKAGKKDATDPRNQMFRQFVRVVRITQPPFLIGENVSGLLAMKSGPREEDPMVIDAIRQAFAEIGYTLTYQVLEATEFGVPQSRKRLLIAGWKTAQNFDTTSFWAAVQAWGAQQTVPKLNSFVKPTLEGALKLDSRAVPTNFETVAIPIGQEAEPTGAPHPYVTLKATSFDETYQEKTYDRLLSCGKRDSPIHSEILDLTKPSKTIICTYDHQPRLLVGLRKPDGTAYARCLLPDELKQIQGFPADFKLCGNVKEQIVQVGNAVPPNLVQAVAQGFKKYLDAPPPQQPPAEPKPKRKYKIVRS